MCAKVSLHVLRLCLVLFLVGAVARAEDYGTPYPEWWTTGRTPRPAATFQRFDKDAFERWVAMQPADAKPVIDFIRANLNHVTQAEFEKQLGKSFESFRGTDTRPLLVVTLKGQDYDVKSNVWATALLREKYPDAFKNAVFFNINPSLEKGYQEKMKEYVDKGYRVLVVDDAMYSGRQLTDPVVELAKVCKEIDVVTGFATNEAFNRLHLNEAFGIPVRFHRGETIATVLDLFNQITPTHKEAFNRVARFGDLFSDHGTLTKVRS